MAGHRFQPVGGPDEAADDRGGVPRLTAAVASARRTAPPRTTQRRSAGRISEPPTAARSPECSADPCRPQPPRWCSASWAPVVDTACHLPCSAHWSAAARLGPPGAAARAEGVLRVGWARCGHGRHGRTAAAVRGDAPERVSHHLGSTDHRDKALERHRGRSPARIQHRPPEHLNRQAAVVGGAPAPARVARDRCAQPGQVRRPPWQCPAVAAGARQLIGVSCQSSSSAPLSVFWSAAAPEPVEAPETSNGSPLRTLISLT